MTGGSPSCPASSRRSYEGRVATACRRRRIQRVKVAVPSRAKGVGSGTVVDYVQVRMSSPGATRYRLVVVKG